MIEQIKAVLAAAKTGTLSVVDFESSAPFGALVNVATDASGLPIFLLSHLARHTKSLVANASASLLVAEPAPEGDALTGFRATIVGEVFKTEDDVESAYISKHPYAELYAGFGDFGFWRMTPRMIYVVAGFGRIKTFPASEVFG